MPPGPLGASELSHLAKVNLEQSVLPDSVPLLTPFVSLYSNPVLHLQDESVLEKIRPDPIHVQVVDPRGELANAPQGLHPI